MFNVNFDETIKIGGIDAKLQNKEVTPDTLPQTIKPDEGFDGIREITIEKDEELRPENLKEGVNVFGTIGTMKPEKPEQEKTVTPATAEQIVKPDEGYVLSGVKVKGDYSLIPENIRKGYAIFGVAGTHEDRKPEQSKTAIPQRDTQSILPDDGYTLSDVIVEGDEELMPENIKEGVNIFGIVGTHESRKPEQEKTAMPTGAAFDVLPDEGKTLSRVSIEGDAMLSPENIKKDISIYGVTGEYDPAPSLEAKTVDAAVNGITIEPGAGYDGLSSVTINAIENLTAENIKKDVQILNIVGTLEGAGDNNFIVKYLTDYDISASIPEGLTEIPNYAFQYMTWLRFSEFPASLSKIGDYAFRGDAGSGVIGSPSYSNKSSKGPLVKGYFPDTIKYIGQQAFYYSQIDGGELSLPSFTTDANNKIGANAFAYSDVESVVFRGTITQYSSQLFYKCPNLKKATFLQGFAGKLPDGLFSGCDNCTLYDFRSFKAVPSITYSSTHPYFTFYREDKDYTGIKIIVPDALYDDWIVATNWAAIADSIVKASEYSEVV